MKTRIRHIDYSKRNIIACLIAVLVLAVPVGSSALIGLNEGDVPGNMVLDALNDNPANVSELFGKKPVILVFWELTTDKSFLNYSLDELRFLNDYYEKYHDKYGLEIFGIYTPEEAEIIPAGEMDAVSSLIKINNIKFPILIDSGFKMFREYGVIALPSTIMVNKTGRIQFIYPSFPQSARAVFTEQINALVGISRIVTEIRETKSKGHDSHSIRLYNYALQMYKKGLLEQALSPLQKSLDMDPEYAWSRNLMGIILWKQDKLKEAMEEFRYAIRLDAKNGPARFNYSVLLFESGNYVEAEKSLMDVISADNEMAEAHYVLGLLYKKANREDEAIKELNTALSAFEKRTDTSMYEIFTPAAYHRISALFALSDLHHQRGDTEQAIRLLQKAAGIALGLETESGGEAMRRSRDLMIYE